MVRPSREAEALRGGGPVARGDDRATDSAVRKRLVWIATATAVAVGVSLGVVAVAPPSGDGAVAGTVSLAASRLRVDTEPPDDESSREPVKRVVDGPPRAWEVHSDPQAGPPVGADDRISADDKAALAGMLRQAFGLDATPPASSSPSALNGEGEATSDKAPPSPGGHDGDDGDAPVESLKEELKEKLLKEFGVDDAAPLSPRTTSTSPDVTATAEDEDNVNTNDLSDLSPGEEEALRDQLKQELRDQLPARLQAAGFHEFGEEQDETKAPTVPPRTRSPASFKGSLDEHTDRLVGAFRAGTLDSQQALAQAQAMRLKIADCIARAAEAAADWIANRCASQPAP